MYVHVCMKSSHLWFHGKEHMWCLEGSCSWHSGSWAWPHLQKGALESTACTASSPVPEQDICSWNTHVQYKPLSQLPRGLHKHIKGVNWHKNSGKQIVEMKLLIPISALWLNCALGWVSSSNAISVTHHIIITHYYSINHTLMRTITTVSAPIAVQLFIWSK